MPKARSKRCKKRSFHGNRYTKANDSRADISSASSSKLKDNAIIYEDAVIENTAEELMGNRIFDLATLIKIFSILCCPICKMTGLLLIEDSKFGMCSNFLLHCNGCSFVRGFSSTPKVKNQNTINTFLVLGLRLIGREYNAGKKLCSTLSLPFLSKVSFRQQEKTLLKCVESCAQDNMVMASSEVRDLKKVSNQEIAKCGVSVDGTCQRRGHSSLNGCSSIISIDTGKVLDVEVLSQYCRACKSGNRYSHCSDFECSNHAGSSGNMEVVAAFRMFERSENIHQLQYVEYYGDGDCKAFNDVKDIYSINSVEKLECVGHVQKRVGGRLRKLKKSKKGLGGKGKLTDKFIDKLQNYYGIAIRSNVGNLPQMQSAVIAAFFHCCSGKNKQMHGQCPKGKDSWCKFQRAEFEGKKLVDKSPGLPPQIINIIKSTYMNLCDKELLKRCLHGRTQNCNESFNGVLWNILPKGTFVELQTLRLGTYIAVILFNSGFAGLLPIFTMLQITLGKDILDSFKKIDNIRIVDSKRHSLQSTKLSRKKRRATRKHKTLTDEVKEGTTYKSGEF